MSLSDRINDWTQLLMKNQITADVYEGMLEAETSGKQIDATALLDAAEKAHLDLANAMTYVVAARAADEIRTAGEIRTGGEIPTADAACGQFERDDTPAIEFSWTVTTRTEEKRVRIINPGGFQTGSGFPAGSGFQTGSGFQAGSDFPTGFPAGFRVGDGPQIVELSDDNGETGLKTIQLAPAAAPVASLEGVPMKYLMPPPEYTASLRRASLALPAPDRALPIANLALPAPAAKRVTFQLPATTVNASGMKRTPTTEDPLRAKCYVALINVARVEESWMLNCLENKWEMVSYDPNTLQIVVRNIDGITMTHVPSNFAKLLE